MERSVPKSRWTASTATSRSIGFFAGRLFCARRSTTKALLADNRGFGKEKLAARPANQQSALLTPTQSVRVKCHRADHADGIGADRREYRKTAVETGAFTEMEIAITSGLRPGDVVLRNPENLDSEKLEASAQ